MGFSDQQRWRRAVPTAAMCRMTTAATAVAGLLFALGACTGQDVPDQASSHPTESGVSRAAPSAPPGRFRTLPEPCQAMPREALAMVFPESQTAPPSPEPTDSASTGSAAVTFDADRVAGCEWTREGVSGSRQLQVDYERVLSYDPAVSDEEQAKRNFLDSELAANLPSHTPGGTGSAESSTEPGPEAQSEARGPVDATKGEPSTDTESPRIISGIGDEAFLDDRFNGTSAEPHRDVKIVFRKANVIVTVRLREWPSVKGEIPSSSAMQVGTHHAAQTLAERLSDQ